ncbi:MAG: DNA polymerase III subunit beta [Clostridia bacterium]|nr:DNA polymerase III subunit beta [Clostridia bacterium]
MKFTCNQQTLAKALNTVSKAVSSRTTIPILKGIMIKATDDNHLILTASDLEISIKKEIEADVQEPGAFVVMAKLFSDIVRKLPNEEIMISEDESGTVIIKTSFSEFNVVSFPTDEFPEIGNKEEGSEIISLDSNIFKEMIRKTAFAASIDESKGVLTGILTEIEEDNIKMVSLDGFRLALVKEYMKSAAPNKFIIAAKVMNEISKIISEEEEESDITIALGEKREVINIGNNEIVIRRMEGEFIKYYDILPADNTTHLIVNRDMLLESIERASLLSREGKNNLIKMIIKNDLMTITSRSEEGNVKEEIIVEKTGNDLEIGFNSKFVLDVMKVIDDEQISLHFKSGVSPCVVKPVEGDHYEYLILPVRIPSM